MFPLEYVFTYSNSLIQTSSTNYLLELFRGRSKIHQKNMSQKSALNIEQWETLSENYKPVRVFVYKLTENNCHLRYFAEFIQTQKRYPTFNSNTTCQIRLQFFWWTTPRELTPCEISNICHCGFKIKQTCKIICSSSNSGLPKLNLRDDTKSNLIYDAILYRMAIIRDQNFVFSFFDLVTQSEIFIFQFRASNSEMEKWVYPSG